VRMLGRGVAALFLFAALPLAAESSASATALSGAVASQSWRIVPSPSGGHGGNLSAISCANARYCIAGGWTTDSPSSPFSELWDGVSWRILPIAQGLPTGSVLMFSAIDCVSDTSCFALGNQALFEHWDGTKWHVTSGGRGKNFLQELACAGSRFCVAVGNTSSHTPLISIWNGAHWIDSHSARPLGLQLTDVSCFSPVSCMAVGGFGGGPVYAERWNGAHWISAGRLTFHGYLAAVSCWSSSGCLATGWGESGSALVARWNGQSWTTESVGTTPGSGDLSLQDVSCAGAARCVVVGARLYPHSQQPVAYSWNGMETHLMPSPHVDGDGSFNSVTVTRGVAFAVGSEGSIQNPGHMIEESRW
jgi:hypothetical protein